MWVSRAGGRDRAHAANLSGRQSPGSKDKQHPGPLTVLASIHSCPDTLVQDSGVLVGV